MRTPKGDLIEAEFRLQAAHEAHVAALSEWERVRGDTPSLLGPDEIAALAPEVLAAAQRSSATKMEYLRAAIEYQAAAAIVDSHERHGVDDSDLDG